MNRWKLPILAVGMALLAVAALACGGDDNDTEQEPTGGTATTDAAGDSDVDQAMAHVEEMVAAAEEGDLAASATHLELADPFLHEVIEDLEATDAALAGDLEEAVEDAEKDIEEGEEAEHIVEIGNEILDLLQQAR